MPGGWKDTSRELSPEYRRLRPLVLKRDMHMCQWIEPLDGRVSKNYSSAVHVYVDPQLVEDSKNICGEHATDVDHIDGYDDVMDNLQSLCEYHHDRKSSAQGNAHRWRYTSTRPKERRAGIIHDDD